MRDRTKTQMRKLHKHIILFLAGGSAYILIETIWRCIMGRQQTHWTMFVLGGLAFVLIGCINEYLSWETPLWKQGLIGAAITTCLEFVFGCVLNLWLKLNVWDYSGLPLNLLGQICLPFSVAWYFLSIVAIVADDWLRYLLFGEERPHYKLS